MKLSYLFAICMCLYLWGCTEKSPIDVMNDRLVKDSNGKYRLQYGDAGCRADYYVNGQYHLDVPKLEHGFYLYYENNETKYPILDFLDNREGRLVVGGLPIRDVRAIAIRDKVMLIRTGDGRYFVDISSVGLPVVRRELIRGNEKVDFDRRIQFLPVRWFGEVQNYSNDFISVADTNIENYQPGATPKIICIRALALTTQHQNNGKPNSVFEYLIGETAYSYFTLNIYTGEVRYIDRTQFSETLLSAGVSSLITSSDYYLREKKIRGLLYKQFYKDTRLKMPVSVKRGSE
jgi:hypothetical protein